MRKRYQKLTAFILLLPALTPLLYILVFHIHQYSSRQEMKNQLETKMLKTISVPANELQWTRKGKEIIIDGKMFDVKDIEYTGDGLALLTGLYDQDETLLIAQLQTKQEEQGSAASKQLTNLLQLVLALPGLQKLETHYLFDALSWAILDDIALSSTYVKILTPPPQV